MEMVDSQETTRKPRGRVLFLEESGVLADSVVECLQHHSFRCRFVDDGRRPDLTAGDFREVDAVLMGLHGNGLGATDKVRAINSLSGGKPLVVLYTVGSSPARGDVLAAGADCVVDKPFRSRELLEALDTSMRPDA